MKATPIYKEKKIGDKGLLFFLLIYILGTFLRFLYINDKSIWFDEAITYSVVNADINKFLKNQFFNYLSGSPFLWVIFKPTIYLPHSEFFLRLPSAISGMLSIIAVFYLFKKIVSYNTALLATFFFSIHPALIWYSQDARIYSFLLLVQLLSTALIFDEKVKNRIFFWVVTGVISIYAHFYSFIVFFLQVIYFIFKRELRWKHIIFIFFLMIPLIYYSVLLTKFVAHHELMKGLSSVKQIIPSTLLNLYSISGNIPERLLFKSDLYRVLYLIFQNILSFLFILLILFSIFKKEYIKINDPVVNRFYIVIIILILFFFPIIHVIIGFPYNPRYSIILIPLALLLLSLFIEGIKIRILKYLIAGFVSVVFIFNIFLLYTTNTSNYRPFTKEILKEISKSESPIVSNSIYYSLILSYYFPDKKITFVIPEEARKLLNILAPLFENEYFFARKECADLENFLQTKTNFWAILIFSDNWKINCDDILLNYIRFSKRFIKNQNGIIFEVLIPQINN